MNITPLGGGCKGGGGRGVGGEYTWEGEGWVEGIHGKEEGEGWVGEYTWEGGGGGYKGGRGVGAGYKGGRGEEEESTAYIMGHHRQ